MKIDNNSCADYRVPFAPEDPMNGTPHKQWQNLSVIDWANLPFHERVLDGMANLLLDADDLLQAFEAAEGSKLARLEPDIRAVYDRVNELMRKITD